jgi:hypothetical protein
MVLVGASCKRTLSALIMSIALSVTAKSMVGVICVIGAAFLKEHERIGYLGLTYKRGAEDREKDGHSSSK